MGDVFVLNFDVVSSPSLTLKPQEAAPHASSMSWGLAWYPMDGPSAIVTKDPVSRESTIDCHELDQARDFRSTLFFTHMKAGCKGNDHHTVEPFSRSYAAKNWLFTLVGKLNKNKLSLLRHTSSDSIEPIGTSGSELIFCYLLNQIKNANARKLSDLKPDELLMWCHAIDACNPVSFIMSDGLSVFCYQGSDTSKPFKYKRITPPTSETSYYGTSLDIALDDPRDQYHTAFIFSNISFQHDEQWQILQPKQLIITRRAAIVWNSYFAQSNHEPPQTELPELAYEKNKTQPMIMNPRAILQAADGTPLTYRIMDVTHSTVYKYNSRVEHSTHMFRLQPTEDALQEVISSTLNISVDGESIVYEDVFGNGVTHYTIDTPYDQLIIENISRVKIYAATPDDHSLSLRQSSIPLRWMPWQQQMMMAYLLPAELPETQLIVLTDYAMSFVERNDYHLLNTLEDMNISIYQDYTYVQGSTSLRSTAFDCFTNREGVCQDFANLFICLARLLGIPARYRMGYIHTGNQYENKLQSDASHAWVELYLPYLGWRGFDPTNGCLVKQDHIRVACGRNYRDATPTSGTIFKGGGEESLSVDVKLIEVRI
ncbi:MAG: class II glutamine amidotransferase [Legionellaceae bacterium]|nr:class II glutamine amidotransferase [Legionellaceae bacterium]